MNLIFNSWKEVLLEWGWVYKDPKKHKKTFFDFEDGINQEVLLIQCPLFYKIMVIMI